MYDTVGPITKFYVDITSSSHLFYLENVAYHYAIL